MSQLSRKVSISRLKRMLYCLQLIITNEEVAYHYATYLTLDSFAASLFKTIKGSHFTISNYLENPDYPFELYDEKNKSVVQLILTNDLSALLEPFDTFETFIETDSRFKSYSLVLFKVGIDSINTIHQFLSELRNYNFNYEIYDIDDVINFFESLQDIEEINLYDTLIQEESNLYKDLINVDDPIMDELVQLLSNQANITTSRPTIVPLSSQEYYEDTARIKSNSYTDEDYDSVITVLNAYSKHLLGPRYCLGAVYSYIRKCWIRAGFSNQSSTPEMMRTLEMIIYNDINALTAISNEEHVKKLVRGVVLEAFMRLKIDPNLYVDLSM